MPKPGSRRIRAYGAIPRPRAIRSPRLAAAPGAFTLASGSLTPVTYAVAWSQQSGQTTGTALVPATASAGFVSTAVLPGCATAPTTTSSLVVSIAPAQLQTMASLTSYTGTLTLLVNPL
ncbi:hypothetical protein [Sphingomonas sp. 22R3R2A-7]|uniref:hypothetical protein n=1 Tax=Sphingomonas sp. 22R3R2A-7 TaxID=3050230 RepID=UPI002FE42598